MKKFSLNIFLAQMQRLCLEESHELFKKWENEIQKLPITTANQILNHYEMRVNLYTNWKESDYLADILVFKLLSTKTPELSIDSFEEIHNLNRMNPNIQTEIINELTEEERMNLLNNFATKLNSLVIQSLVLALNEKNQKDMMIKYKNEIIKSDFKCLLLFIATLTNNNQQIFLSEIKEYASSLSEEQLSLLILSVEEENIEFFFNEYKDFINNLNEEDFFRFLSSLSEDNITLCTKIFKDKFNKIDANSLMYKTVMTMESPESLYNFWKKFPNKTKQLNSTFFNLLISRIEKEHRLDSIVTFRDRYDELDAKELLELFEFDSDEIKTKVFETFPNKINELETRTLIDYIHTNIVDVNLKNQIFISYKEKISASNDEDFIYFVEEYSSLLLGNLYIYYKWEQKEEKIQEFTKLITNTYSQRFKSISEEFIPTLFKKSSGSIQNECIVLLKENISSLLKNKTYAENFISSMWGAARSNLLNTFKDDFTSYNAEDWYKLVYLLYNDKEFNIIEDMLLTCEINSLDFVVEKEQLSKSETKMLQAFEKNIQNKSYNEYIELINLGKIDVLMQEYENLITLIVDQDKEKLLLDYTSIKLLSLLKILLANKIINTTDEFYQLFKEIYIGKLINNLENENTNNIVKICDALFYRIVKGNVSPTNLLKIKTQKGLILFNRTKNGYDSDNMQLFSPKELETIATHISEQQAFGINIKLFNQLCEKISENFKYDSPSKTAIRKLATKLYLGFGFQNAKKIINLNIPFTTCEYLFDNINIQNISLNENGEPILNKHLINFLFGNNSNDESVNINRLNTDEFHEFKKNFPTIYNNWPVIYEELNGKITLNRVLNFFQENKTVLFPHEYKLYAIIKELRGNKYAIEEARKVYQKMKEREFSTIPKVIGNFDEEYNYEILDLDDPLGIIVGYLTRCCFLLDGASRSSLDHALTDKNGRIFVVRKGTELVAQSWIWRKGNLVCFDNVETSDNYNENTLLEVYKKASNDIISISERCENSKEKVKLVTFGGSYSKIAFPEEKVPHDKIQIPESSSYLYTDAKHDQYILAQKDNNDMYYGEVEAKYIDERKPVKAYTDLLALQQEERSEVIKKIRAIDYAKNSNIREIDFRDYCYTLITDDWYFLITNTGDIECEILNNDLRVKNEFFKYISNLQESLKENNIRINAEDIKKKALVLGGFDYE